MGNLGTPDAAERRSLDLALGMIVSVMRSASDSLDGAVSLPVLFESAKQMGALEFEPDAGALAMARQDDSDEVEAEAYAKTITLYRHCIDNGLLEGTELSQLLVDAFDQLPVITPLMHSAIYAAKQMVQIDVDFMLNPEHAHVHS